MVKPKIDAFPDKTSYFKKNYQIRADVGSESGGSDAPSNENKMEQSKHDISETLPSI